MLRRFDSDLLPADVTAWRFVLAGNLVDVDRALSTGLEMLGFGMAHCDVSDVLERLRHQARTVLVAPVSWLAKQRDALRPFLHKVVSSPFSAPMIVGWVDSEELRAQADARQAGARLLIDASVEIEHLISELAGVAWMPRRPYRVLLVDDDEAILRSCTRPLKQAGCEIVASADPLKAWDIMEELRPEVCVLDMEMPGCHGSDLAVLLHRDKRFARVPMIFLSAFDDLEHQLAARFAGSEDYLVKPADLNLLVGAVVARARQFRLFEANARQRRLAWRRLANLERALDVHAMVAVTDLDGAIIDVNRTFCDACGYSREELIGQNHRLLSAAQPPPGLGHERWKGLSIGTVWHAEVENRRKDGASYWSQSTVVPIPGADDQPEQLIWVNTDITDQKRLLAQLSQRNRLLCQLRQALDAFVAGSPLADVSAILLDGMLTQSGSTLGLIGEVALDPHGAPVLRCHAVSDLARSVESPGQAAPQAGPGTELHDLETLFGEALTSDRAFIDNDRYLDARGSQRPAGLPAIEHFVGLPVRQAGHLVGLIGLANRPGGYSEAQIEPLSVLTATYANLIEATRLKQLQQHIFHDLCRVRIEEEEDLKRRDERLRRWERDARASLNAVLGHAQILLLPPGVQAGIREQIQAIAQGGEQLETLIATLIEELRPAPLESAVEVALASPEMRPAPPTPRRVLVAEDNPANQQVLRMQLEALGFEADIAGDGSVALTRWKAGGHVLILADRSMPGMDGLALARSIRAAEQATGQHIPIIAISAAHHPDELAVCIQAGMDDALPKPVEIDDLRRVLAKWTKHLPPPRPAPVAQTSTPGATPLLDILAVARVIGDRDPAKIRELVDVFTATASADLPACQAAVSAGEGQPLIEIMHKLKSSARMVGAGRFADIAEQVETMVRRGEVDAAKHPLERLREVLDDVKVAADRLLETPVRVPAEIHGEEMSGIILPPRVLVVDDDPVARRQMSLLLRSIGISDVLLADDAESALGLIERESAWDGLLITDLSMPGMDGIEFLRALAERGYRHLITHIFLSHEIPWHI